MDWEPTDLEDAICTLRGLKPTFRQVEEENQYGLELLRTKGRAMDLGVDYDENDSKTKYDAHAELQLKGYLISLKEKFGKKSTSGNNEETDSEAEITHILREAGQERVPVDYRLNSKTTSRTAVSTSRLPVAGVKNLYLTDDHFKFSTPLTYQNSPASNGLERTKEASVATNYQPRNIEASISTTTKTKVSSDVSKEVMQQGFQDSTEEQSNQMLRQSQRSYEQATVSVPGEQFYSPRQLYFMKARQNR